MEPVKAAFLYATKEDQKYCTDLRRFIAPFERSELLQVEEFDIHVASLTRQEAARFDVFFCLLSPAFLYFFIDDEENNKFSFLIKEKTVVPILIRPSLWQTSDFAKIQSLPKSKVPVVLWSNANAAFLEIAEGIKQKAENIQYEKLSREREMGDYQIEELLIKEDEFFRMVEELENIFDERYQNFKEREFFWNYFIQRHGYEISGTTRRDLERMLLEEENLRMREISIEKDTTEIIAFVDALYQEIPQETNRSYCLVIYDLESAIYNDYQAYKSSFSRNYGKFMTIQEATKKYRFDGKLKIAYKVFNKREVSERP